MHENDHHGHASRSLLRVRCCPVGGAAVAALTVPLRAVSDRRTRSLRGQRGRQDRRLGGHLDRQLLDSHPETNQALTTISQQPAGPQSLAALKTYFDANPQAGKDMQQLQQPLVSLSGRCKLPITLPQLMGLMQAAQAQGGALPSGGLPGGLQAAQTVGVPGAVLPAQPSPASAVTPGSRPAARSGDDRDPLAVPSRGRARWQRAELQISELLTIG